MDYPEDFTTVTIPFTTHQANGAPVAPSSAFETADFKIYKNGSATEKTSTNGLTIQSPHDSETGVHMLIIDTSNNTGDSGFWVAGAVYDVYLDPDETVDGIVVARWVGKFSLGMVQNAVATIAARVAELWQIHGLDIANAMTVTPTTRVAGAVSQTISGDGTTSSVVTRV
jgi:hypothetical protein